MHNDHSSKNKLLFILIFTTALMLLEFLGAIFSGSLALLGDAGHMLTDSMALILSYIAIIWSTKPANSRKTFGYHRFEIIAALVNGLTLLAISGYIFYEAIQRFFHPVTVQSGPLIIIAVIGFIGNLVGVLLLRHDHEESLNIRGAFLHLVGDMLSSVGVIVGGIVIYYTGWNVIDSLIGIMIGGIVLRGAWGLILESSNILLEAVPADISISELKKDVESIPGVLEFHDIHVWTIKSGLRALSAHILTNNITTKENQSLVLSVKKHLSSKFNIAHTTIESECESCQNDSCELNSTKGI